MLFAGESDIHQIVTVFDVMGVPTDIVWPEWSSTPDYGKLVFHPGGVELRQFDVMCVELDTTAKAFLEQMLQYSAATRPSAAQLLQDAYFKSE